MAAPFTGGLTNTAEGLLLMRIQAFDPQRRNLNGDRADVPNIAIFITDGESNIAEHNTIPYADDAVRDGITVMAVGIGSEVNREELKGISSTGVLRETYWMSPNTDVANDIIESIVKATCDVATDIPSLPPGRSLEKG